LTASLAAPPPLARTHTRFSAILLRRAFSESSTAPAADSPAARRYNKIRRWLGFADFAIGIALLIVLLATGWTDWLRDLALRRGFQNYTLSVFVYLFFLMAIGKVLGLGLDYYSFQLERKFQLSTQRFRSWIWDETKGFLVGLVLGGIVVELIYFTIRQWPQHWWIAMWAIFMTLFIVMAQLAPVVLFPIFYRFEPLENEDLRRRLVQLSERAGTHVRGVYRWRLSEKSKKANAALTGLGSTRRIILADTLLDNYAPEEIEAVLAHELGHHVHRHILKSIFVQAGVTLLGFWLANWVLHYSVDHHMFEELSDFANLPLLALTATVVSLLLMPALNAYSRYNERQADRYAFESIATVDPFISSMNKLAQQNLSERTPARWVEVLFHSHPAISRRLAAAESWREQNQPVNAHA
jgi:STE24 endopeptidase